VISVFVRNLDVGIKSMEGDLVLSRTRRWINLLEEFGDFAEIFSTKRYQLTIEVTTLLSSPPPIYCALILLTMY